MSNRGNLVVISAPSGSGKTSLADLLLKEVDGMKFSVSHTTRPRRQGEEHGVEYFFVTVEVFEQMVSEGAFLEYAHVYDNYYGTGSAFVEAELAKGRDVLLDIDIQGALKVKQLVPEALMIFVMPPSFQELKERLVGRGLDDEVVIERRLQIAKNEIKYYVNYDFVIINNEIKQCLQELKSIVLAARCRADLRKQAAEAIVDSFFSSTED
jgi:guanylate kinase